MTPQAVARRIRAEYDTLSARTKSVAAYVLEHPADVALLSMREQARRANVPPATMTRFAQRLGYSGYDELRSVFAASIRGSASDFAARADELAARRIRVGEPTLAHELASALVDRVAVLLDSDRVAAIVDAAGVLADARRIYCLGHRSCYAPAFYFSYFAGLYGSPTWLLDAPGGTGSDGLNSAKRGDAMLAISFAPYTRSTVRIAKMAREFGVEVVALTDSPASPLARPASRTIMAPSDLVRATHVTTPAFAVSEMLAVLVVARRRADGRAKLERNEAGFARRHVYWSNDLEAVS